MKGKIWMLLPYYQWAGSEVTVLETFYPAYELHLLTLRLISNRETITKTRDRFLNEASYVFNENICEQISHVDMAWRPLTERLCFF